jgi:mono/diheme cytochrome c family protein
VAIAIALLPALTGCGSNANSNSATSASSGDPTKSRYDSGPRAGEQAIDGARVAAGEQLFKDKGCSACHTFGRKMSGPDLAGVTMRRTAQWMENQILHPEVMTKEDPISRQLFAQFALQMPNQGLTPEEAKSVIEYLKHQNHESGEHEKEKGE